LSRASPGTIDHFDSNQMITS